MYPLVQKKVKREKTLTTNKINNLSITAPPPPPQKKQNKVLQHEHVEAKVVTTKDIKPDSNKLALLNYIHLLNL